ncbi:MAG TPA: winged helix-turn-helix transcriptional regulator [Desulfitobacterium dehalogenans]|uniref:Winged helix-turn-helix transcriptional regulator n=1 Tax=Desulfitobacterium dehalogenans TaxID=36854 RepID=A0A7C6Z3H6_9FIRM|nr:winged helix-turn-helix transcriptional regulator [Desulfitobacterium dehalogenans]
MDHIDFDQGSLTVTWAGRSISLLPKEYALLEYLYEHLQQTFSRNQLLDAVWPLESPIDRTVDDHIYRIRKKLTPWHPLVRIETVRGVGYRLITEQPKSENNLLLHAPAFTQEMQKISKLYLKFGRGDALLALRRHKETFGVAWDTSFEILIRILEGDVRFLVEDESIPFYDRAFHLLYLNQLLDPHENRHYVEAVLQKELLPSVWQYELENIIIISMLMDWGDYDKAKAKLDFLSAEVSRQGWDGLIPYVANLKIEYDLHIGDWENLTINIKDAENLLQQYPYQREQGQFTILKGIALYRVLPHDALSFIELGHSLLAESHFLPHLIRGINTVRYFAKKFEWETLSGRYDNQWNQLSRRIGLAQSKEKINELLQKHLIHL